MATGTKGTIALGNYAVRSSEADYGNEDPGDVRH